MFSPAPDLPPAGVEHQRLEAPELGHAAEPGEVFTIGQFEMAGSTDQSAMLGPAQAAVEEVVVFRSFDRLPIDPENPGCVTAGALPLVRLCADQPAHQGTRFLMIFIDWIEL